MVGSDQVPPERLPASLGRGSRGTVRRSDNVSRVHSLEAGVLLRSSWGEEPKTKAAKERSSTALRFASFPVPLWGTGRAVKGRDARRKKAVPPVLFLRSDPPTRPALLALKHPRTSRVCSFVESSLFAFVARFGLAGNPTTHSTYSKALSLREDPRRAVASKGREKTCGCELLLYNRARRICFRLGLQDRISSARREDPMSCGACRR